MKLVIPLGLLFALACGSTPPGPDAAARDAAVDGSTDTGDEALDSGGEERDASADALDQETVRVGHAREMRGGWIASVYNINWPSRTGLSAEAQRSELEARMDDAANAGLNAVFLQVRPEGDAFYPSELEPWSRFLSGTQGVAPGWDPLETAIRMAHARGLELHAWMNPYRAKASASSTAVAPHAAVTLSEHMIRYGDLLWMDPGAEAVQDHTLAVIRDVLTRYDVDGLHFDDYFYPYPDGPFPDDDSFDAYRSGGGTLDRGDWRRDNVNHLVERIAEIVREVAPTVRWGISPFGIYRPGMPEGITGLDQYASIYADPPLWIRNGWVDYLAPQLYWPSTQTRQAYEPLAQWWGALATEGRLIFIGNYLSKVGTETAWDLDELRTQLRMTREAPGVEGNLYFHVAPLDGRAPEIAEVLQNHYVVPAATPPIADAFGATLAPPAVRIDGAIATVTHASPLRYVGVYGAIEPGVFTLDRLVPAGSEEGTGVGLEPGEWALSAIDRRGVESEGVIVQIE